MTMVHSAVPPPARARGLAAAAAVSFAAAAGVVALAFALTLGLGGCRRAASSARLPPDRAGEASRAQAAPPRPPATASDPTAAEKAAIEDFLRRHTGLRAAGDGDRRGSSDSDADMKNLYGVYHPYFVRGDVNDDGVLDFVMAFVRRDPNRAPRFTIVAFLGGAENAASATTGAALGFSAGTLIERDVSLARGDVSIDRDSIVITPDLDEDTIRRYRWDAASRSFVFVREADDDSDPPSVSRTGARDKPVDF
jgi:hypothetical protein